MWPPFPAELSEVGGRADYIYQPKTDRPTTQAAEGQVLGKIEV
jgi:hypothetical protein